MLLPVRFDKAKGWICKFSGPFRGTLDPFEFRFRQATFEELDLTTYCVVPGHAKVVSQGAPIGAIKHAG